MWVTQSFYAGLVPVPSARNSAAGVRYHRKANGANGSEVQRDDRFEWLKRTLGRFLKPTVQPDDTFLTESLVPELNDGVHQMSVVGSIVVTSPTLWEAASVGRATSSRSLRMPASEDNEAISTGKSSHLALQTGRYGCGGLR